MTTAKQTIWLLYHNPNFKSHTHFSTLFNNEDSTEDRPFVPLSSHQSIISLEDFTISYSQKGKLAPSTTKGAFMPFKFMANFTPEQFNTFISKALNVKDVDFKSGKDFLETYEYNFEAADLQGWDLK